eukprot:UN06467
MVKTTFPRVPRFPLVSALPLPWNLDRGLSLDQDCQVLFSPFIPTGLATESEFCRPPICAGSLLSGGILLLTREISSKRTSASGSSSEGSGLLLGFRFFLFGSPDSPWLSLSWSLIVIVGIFRRPSFSSFTGSS